VTPNVDELVGIQHMIMEPGHAVSELVLMKLIIGLGNPGPEYDSTKHNAGFRVVDFIANKYAAVFANKKELHCQLAKLEIEGQPVLLVKPTSFMNNSGRAVTAVLNWHKELQLSDLIIVHDDVSLPLGRLRLQHDGGAGGHHGIESAIECLGDRREFDRLKFGVGPDPGGDIRAEYVLSSIPTTLEPLYKKCTLTAADALECWLSSGIQEAMNKFNGITVEL
jgi:peptidyl-tRNA hydrolase, PTH1 family